MMNGQEMTDCMGMMGSMGWAMWVFGILLVALVAWSLYRLFATRDASTPPRETPLERLQQRYAEGDLSTEEYEERKRTLEGAP